jgi:RNA polymerase sigma-70 factor (ECF subfamily)
MSVRDHNAPQRDELHGVLLRLSRAGSTGIARDPEDLESLHSLLVEGDAAPIAFTVRRYLGARPGYRRLVAWVYDERDLVAEGRDAVLAALERGRYTGERCFPFAFVRQVVWCLLRDLCLRERRRQSGRLDELIVADGATVDPVARIPDPSESPLDAVARGETGQALRILLEELPERDRELLLGRHVEGLSHAELARRSGPGGHVSAGAMRTRVHRLHGRLRARVLADPRMASALGHPSGLASPARTP